MERKKLTNFYETKQLQEEIIKEKLKYINYTNVKEFSKQEAFTPKTVDEKLVTPIMKANKILTNENQFLRLELSKAKNAVRYYKKLENENADLKQKAREQEIEINAMYKLIKKLNEKCENLIKWVKDKFGIDKSDIDRKLE